MVTSLQKQLASIASKSTHQLDLKAQSDLHSKSLLFEPKVAAKQDFDTLYQTCLEGFEELCLLDKRFRPFKVNLFNAHSKTQNRAQMTQKENEALDTLIDRFLSLVSAKLLVRPAIKAVEWLIRRFSAHEYNISAMVMAFLPYHADKNVPIFVNLLSILPTSKLPPTYRFLHPYIRTLSHPPISAIVYTASHDVSFFTSFNQFYIQMAKQKAHSQALIAFWASVMVQATHSLLDGTLVGRKEVQAQKQEDVTIRLLSVLKQGFALAADKDMATACMMITMVFCSKADLSNDVIDGLMTTVASISHPELQNETLACLAILAQSREGSGFPKGVAKWLFKLPSGVDLLRQLSVKTQVENLVYGSVIGTLEGRYPDLQQVAFTASCATEFLDDSRFSKCLETALQNVQSQDKPISQLKFCTQYASAVAQDQRKSQVVSGVIKRLNISEADLENLCGSSIALTQSISSAPAKPSGTQEPTDSTSTFANRLASIPAFPSGFSFLSSFEIESFRPLLRLFEEALGNADTLDSFTNATIFKTPTGLNEITFISFLLRVLSSASSVHVKLGALEVLRSWFKSPKNPGIQAQVTLPFLIISLTDSSKSVRSSAFSALQDASACFSASAGKPWSYQEIYGISLPDLTYPTGAEVISFLQDVIFPHHDGISLDGSYVLTLISEAFASDAGGSKKSKLSPISATYSFFGSHAASCTLLPLRVNLLRFLSRNNKVKNKLKGTAPILSSIKQWASIPKSALDELCRVQSVDIPLVNNAYFATMSPFDVDCVAFLHALVKNLAAVREDIARAAVDRIVQVWSLLGSSLRESFTSSLLDVAVDRRDIALFRSMAVEALQSVDLSAQSILGLVQRLPKSSQIHSQLPATKRRKVGNSDDNRDVSQSQEIVEALAVYDITLSLVQKSSFSDPAILSALFSILEELHGFGTKADSSLVYLQGIALSCLLDIVQRLKQIPGFKVDIRLIRTDLLVDCVRQAPSSQVLSSALLLISSLASWVPEIVLHGVMPIFTFIGNTILRQSDDFSIHVVNEALAHIVPPLVSSLQSKNEAVVSGVSELLMSFTTAFDHIPSHRRLHLFETLARTLGPSDCLYAIAIILAERYPTDDDVMQFVISLFGKFSPDVTLLTLNQYAHALVDLVNDRPGPAQALVSLDENADRDVNKLIANLVNFLSILVDKETTRNRIGKYLRKSGSGTDEPHQQFSAFVQDLITLSQACRSNPVASRPCRNALSGAFRLLPAADIVKAAQVFLANVSTEADLEILHIFLRSLDTQVKRLRNVPHETCLAFIDLLPALSAAVSSSAVSIKSSAIVCIDEIIRRFGKVNPTPIFETARVIAGSDALGMADESIRVASIFCLGSCVEAIKEQFIPLLPDVFSRVVEYVGARETAENKLFVPSFFFLNAVCESIPFMFSGKYLETSLQLLHSSASLELSAEEVDIRKQFLELVVLNIDAPGSFGAISRTFKHALLAGPAAITMQLKTLQMVLQRHANATVIKHASTLFTLFGHAFDIRSALASQNLAASELAKVENLVIDTTLAMVLKLNDSVFRPFFSHLIQWAQTSSGDDSSKDLACKSRTITVFRFSEAMFARLKSLVTGYSTDILDCIINVLVNAPLIDEVDADLVKYGLAALQQSFEFDQDDFWQSPNNFDRIVSPLVGFLDRLARSALASSDLIDETAIPAVVDLAVTAASPDHHKEINTILLRGMRSDNSQVRLAVVKCQRKLTDRLGEEWLSLLPELLPIISELQEDDEEKVEVETLKWIKMMEKILGESMDSMLR